MREHTLARSLPTRRSPTPPASFVTVHVLNVRCAVLTRIRTAWRNDELALGATGFAHNGCVAHNGAVASVTRAAYLTSLAG